MSGRGKIELPGRRALAAAWWSASLRLRSPLGLLAGWSPPLVYGVGLAAGVGVGVGGCAESLSETPTSSMDAALEAQREQGWTAGEQGTLLAFPDAQETDIAGSAAWREALSALALRLAPAEPRWLPFYDPTLFQSLQAPRSADLRLMMRPIFSSAMALASRRGQAMLSLFMEDGGCRNDVALVLDIPGPEAVALAAALAPCFDPVFAFANWPHPRGVVPSHLTLGAALYYLPWFERERARRPPGSAPAFVIDRQRLAPYSDDGARFDNRYAAGLPALETLAAAGIEHVLYVTPDDQIQAAADDINDDLVALDRAGIDVRLLALSDFSGTPLAGWPDEPPEPPEEPPPEEPASVSLDFYFGGSPYSHRCFWEWYRWPSPHRPRPAVAPPPAPARLLPRTQFRPAPRPVFSSGFRGSPPGRSGSLGRSHFGGMSG